jgi:hypothetical protein
MFVGTTMGIAQEVRATVGGKVTDAQGALIPNASVTLVSGDSGVSSRTKTNGQGNWVVQFLNPGHYSFTVAVSGFKTAERSGIEL